MPDNMETERLILRPLRQDDFEELCTMLQDSEVMYAWEKTFTPSEVRQWIGRMQRYYEIYGYAYLLAMEKSSGKVVGQIGLLPELIAGREYVGIGYILKKEAWGNGYATEGAKACIRYAFDRGVPEVIAEIRPENKNSLHVAERLGMKPAGKFVKNVDGKEMLHMVYTLANPGCRSGETQLL